jgi:hypothetical protein
VDFMEKEVLESNEEGLGGGEEAADDKDDDDKDDDDDDLLGARFEGVARPPPPPPPPGTAVLAPTVPAAVLAPTVLAAAPGEDFGGGRGSSLNCFSRFCRNIALLAADVLVAEVLVDGDGGGELAAVSL